MRKFGYAMISIYEPNTVEIFKNLNFHDCDLILFDFYQNQKREYESIEHILNNANPGDILVVLKLSMLAVNLKHLRELIERIESTGLNITIHEANISTNNKTRSFYFQFLKSSYNIELSEVKKITLSGLKQSKKKGVIGGRRPGISKENMEKVKVLKKIYQKDITILEQLNILKVSKGTYYRWVKLIASGEI